MQFKVVNYLKRAMSISSSEEIFKNLQSVNERIRLAFEQLSPEKRLKYPRLVAVSKTKPVEAILEAYSAGQRHFGENYVNELVEKSNDQRLLTQCPEIRWHFIGTLQSGNVSKLCSKVVNLFLLETVDSMNLANNLQKRWKNLEKTDKLNVLVQVNTSKEDQKSGVEISEAVNLANHICENCDFLNFMGFMTVGSVEHSRSADNMNSDFQVLVNLRRDWCSVKNKPENDYELSMGMSADFETAVKMGSTNVRIGSTIFGTRDYSIKQ